MKSHESICRPGDRFDVNACRCNRISLAFLLASPVVSRRCFSEDLHNVYFPVPAFGGYSFSSTVTLGAHWHHSASGMTSITLGMCRPHPNQDDLAVAQSDESSRWRTMMVNGHGDLQQVGQVCFMHIFASCFAKVVAVVYSRRLVSQNCSSLDHFHAAKWRRRIRRPCPRADMLPTHVLLET